MICCKSSCDHLPSYLWSSCYSMWSGTFRECVCACVSLFFGNSHLLCPDTEYYGNSSSMVHCSLLILIIFLTPRLFLFFLAYKIYILKIPFNDLIVTIDLWSRFERDWEVLSFRQVLVLYLGMSLSFLWCLNQ